MRENSRTGRALQHCYAQLADAGIDFEALNLPPNPRRFWDELHGGAAVPGKVQRLISHALANRKFDELLRGASAEHQALLRSGCVRGAGLYLVTAPSRPEFHIPNEDVEFVVRFRALLPPTDDMPERCVCGVHLADDAQHAHACPRLRRRTVTGRHNDIARRVAAAARLSGDWVVEENQTDHDRLDLDIMSHRRELVDVQIASPCTPTLRDRASRRTLYAASMRERSKTRRYEAITARLRAHFVPFLMETTGALGNKASAYLRVLASRIALNPGVVRPALHIRVELAAELSIAVARGNARVYRQWLQFQLRR